MDELSLAIVRQITTTSAEIRRLRNWYQTLLL